MKDDIFRKQKTKERLRKISRDFYGQAVLHVIRKRDVYVTISQLLRSS